MGSKPTAGYSVKVTSVDLVAPVGSGAQPYIAVSYVETVAGDGAAAGVTAPYTVIKFPRQDGIPYGAVSSGTCRRAARIGSTARSRARSSP